MIAQGKEPMMLEDKQRVLDQTKVRWTDDVKRIFLDICLEQLGNRGRRHENRFDRPEWEKITKLFNEKCDSKWDVEKCKTLNKSLKDSWNTVKLQNNSGLGCNKKQKIDQQNHETPMLRFIKKFEPKFDKLYGGTSARGSSCLNPSDLPSSSVEHVEERHLELESTHKKQKIASGSGSSQPACLSFMAQPPRTTISVLGQNNEAGEVAQPRGGVHSSDLCLFEKANNTILETNFHYTALIQNLLGDYHIPLKEGIPTELPFDPKSSPEERSRVIQKIKKNLDTFMSLDFNEIIHPDRRHIVKETIGLLFQISSGDSDPCNDFATNLNSTLAASGNYERIIRGINVLEALSAKESVLKADIEGIHSSYFALKSEQESIEKKITDAEKKNQEIDAAIFELGAKKAETLKVIAAGKVKAEERSKKREALAETLMIKISKKQSLEKELQGSGEKKKELTSDRDKIHQAWDTTKRRRPTNL